MHYQPLTNDKKAAIDLPDTAFQSTTASQLAVLNHTRTILLALTSTELFISLFGGIVAIFGYVFGYTLGGEPYSLVIRFLLFISCICFLIGLVATDRYHAKGLHFFAKAILVNLIISYLVVTIFIIIPICLNKYKLSTRSTILFALCYQTAFLVIALLPAYTTRLAFKLSKLLTDNKY